MAEIRGDRMLALMEAQGINRSQLARRTGLQQPSITKIITGQTRGSKSLPEIAKELNTSIEYLTGETDSPELNSAPSSIEAAEKLNSVLIPQLEIGYSMGGGSVFESYVESDQVPFPRQWLAPRIKGAFADLFVARGDGDSMVPTLMDGDMVVVDTAQKNIDKQDRLWCLSYGELGMIKRLRVLPDGGVQVNSDNPAVTPFTAYDDEMHIIGRVIWVARAV